MELISDPFNGPFEGEDYCIDDSGVIQISDNNVKTAALIMRKANQSGLFKENLVKIGHTGDNILLGFDTLIDAESVFKVNIGYKRDTVAEIKQDQSGKFCIYLDKKRSAKLFDKLANAKTFIKRLDKDLQSVGNTVATYEESDD